MAMPTPQEEEESLNETIAEVLQTRAPALVPVFERLKPVLAVVGRAVDVVGPYVVKAGHVMVKLYSTAPTDLVYAAYGMVMCFFGGCFITLISAIEAFKICGGESIKVHWSVLQDDYKRAMSAALKDQSEGEMSQQITQKLLVAMKSVKNPEAFMSSLTAFYTAGLAVITTLRVKFARTVTLGASIGEMITGPTLRYVQPSLLHITPPEYHKWVPTLLRTSCRLMGITIGWMAQRVVSGVQSAMWGGTMFSHRMLSFTAKRQWRTRRTPDEEAMLAEYLGYLVAAFGVYFQLRMGFTVPYPLSLFTWPLTVVESCLQILV